MQLGIDQVLAWLHHRFLSFDGIIHGCLLSKISDILWIGDAEQRGLLDLNLPFVEGDPIDVAVEVRNGLFDFGKRRFVWETSFEGCVSGGRWNNPRLR